MTHTPIAKHACASDVITVIRDTRKPLGKVYRLGPNGSVQKTVSAKVGVVDAVMRHVPDHDAMAGFLRELSNDPHAALINAGFNGVACRPHAKVTSTESAGAFVSMSPAVACPAIELVGRSNKGAVCLCLRAHFQRP